MALTPAERKRQSELVARQFELWIEQRTPAAGEVVGTVRSLMERYDTTSSVVRGAAAKLEERGIVDRRRGVGIVFLGGLPGSNGAGSTDAGGVERLSLNELVDTRFLIEEQTASAAARLSTDDSAARLLELAAAAPADAVDNAAADTAFHLAIAEAAGNRILVRTLREVLTRLVEATPDLIERRQALTDHQAIVDAIERHDAQGAHMAMRVHLLRERRALEQIGLLPPYRR